MNNKANSKLITVLEKIEANLELVISGGDTVAEHYYTWGPNQGIIAQLRASGIQVKQFFINSANSGAILSPLLFLQAFLLLLKAAMRFARLGLSREIKDKNDIVVAVSDIVAAGLTAGLAVLLLLASAKILMITYFVQAAIGFAASIPSFAKETFGYIKQSIEHRRLQAELAALSKIPEYRAEARLVAVGEQIKEVAKKRSEKYETAKIAGNNMLLGGVILALVVVSFLVPIPIVAQVAQVALAVIVTALFVKGCVERYKKYKAAKAKQAGELPIANADKPDELNKLRPEVQAKSELTFKEKAGAFFKGIIAASKKKLVALVFAGTVAMAAGVAGEPINAMANGGLDQSTAITEQSSTDTSNQEPNIKDSVAEITNLLKQDNSHKNESTSTAPTPSKPKPEDPISTSDDVVAKRHDEIESKPESAEGPKMHGYGSREKAMDYYKKQHGSSFFKAGSKGSQLKDFSLPISRMIEADNDDLRSSNRFR